MSNTLEINGNILHPIKDAAKAVSYSRDYVTRLAREQKITANLVGRQWFVDLDSLQKYAELSAIEQELRKKQLSEERKRERKLREEVEQKNTFNLSRTRSMHSQASAVAGAVLCFGLVIGWAATNFSENILYSNSQNPARVIDSAETNTVTSIDQSLEPASVQTPPVQDFSSRTVSDMGNLNDGVVLFPQATSTEVVNLFSDEVVVRTLSDGTEVVVRVDESGNVVGNSIPFVSVPVRVENN